MFGFVKKTIVKNKGDLAEPRGPIRRKWSGPRPVPMVAPGGHFFSNSASAEHINSTMRERERERERERHALYKSYHLTLI